MEERSKMQTSLLFLEMDKEKVFEQIIFYKMDGSKEVHQVHSDFLDITREVREVIKQHFPKDFGLIFPNKSSKN